MNEREMSCLDINSKVFVQESSKVMLASLKLGLIRTRLEWRAHACYAKPISYTQGTLRDGLCAVGYEILR
jgi:hypothetical protein